MDPKTPHRLTQYRTIKQFVTDEGKKVKTTANLFQTEYLKILKKTARTKLKQDQQAIDKRIVVLNENIVAREAEVKLDHAIPDDYFNFNQEVSTTLQASN